MVLVGENLKKIREGKKINLSAVSNSLNISIDFLISIENDDFSKIPGNAYTIGYIRSYSNFLDLDASEIVKLYKNQVFYSDKEVPVKIQKPIQKFNFFPSYQLVSFFAIVSLSLAFYFLFINGKNNHLYYAITPDISENLQYQIEEIELEEALMTLKQNNKESLETKYENLSLEENNLLNTNKNLLNNDNRNLAIAALTTDLDNQDLGNIITIKALEDTWIQLRNNKDEIIHSSLMNINDEYSYSIYDDYNITTGNAGNLIISIDGKVKGKLGKKGEIIETLIITSDFFN